MAQLYVYVVFVKINKVFDGRGLNESVHVHSYPFISLHLPPLLELTLECVIAPCASCLHPPLVCNESGVPAYHSVWVGVAIEMVLMRAALIFT